MRRESHVRFWESARVRIPRATRHGEHRHSGIALLTPEDVHQGRVAHRRNARQTVLSSRPGRLILSDLSTVRRGRRRLHPSPSSIGQSQIRPHNYRWSQTN